MLLYMYVYIYVYIYKYISISILDNVHTCILEKLMYILTWYNIKVFTAVNSSCPRIMH